MKKFKKIDIQQYPAHILAGYSSSVKEQLAEESLMKQNYDEFRYIVENMGTLLFNILNTAIERFDLKAVKVIIDVAKNSGDNFLKNGEYIEEYHMSSVMKKDVFDTLIHRNKKIEIFKVLIEERNSEDIEPNELKYLATLFSKEEFADFCARKNLDLSSDKFRSFHLLECQSDKSIAGLVLDDVKNAKTLMDLLLSRTFSDKITSEEMKKIYTDLYNLHPIAKEMILYTGALIFQNNDIKVIFCNANPAYYMDNNVITINNNFIYEEIFNINSVVIHEMGHFVYHTLLNLEGVPFDIRFLLEELEELEYLDNKVDPFIIQEAHITHDFIFGNQTRIENFRKIFDLFNEYEAAARKPVDKAADMLLFDKNEYAKYVYTQEYVEYFKRNSYIDIFELSGLKKFGEINQSQNTILNIDEDIFDNILQIYLNNHDYCLYDPFLQTPVITKELIEGWAITEFLPELINDLNLSKTQLHFLERIADYVNRGDHLLNDVYYMNNINSSEKYVELMVRAMELRAAKIEDDLIASFKDLEEYHIKYFSPLIQQEIEKSGIFSLTFDDTNIAKNDNDMNANLINKDSDQNIVLDDHFDL